MTSNPSDDFLATLRPEFSGRIRILKPEVLSGDIGFVHDGDGNPVAVAIWTRNREYPTLFPFTEVIVEPTHVPTDVPLDSGGRR